MIQRLLLALCAVVLPVSPVLAKAPPDTAGIDSAAAGGSAEFHRFDVRDAAEADRLIAAIGTVDVLIANAGIAHKVPLDALTGNLQVVGAAGSFLLQVVPVVSLARPDDGPRRPWTGTTRRSSAFARA